MSTGAILLCAGAGSRLGADLPKALVPLAGRPLFAWSLEAFERCDDVDSLVVVGPVRQLRDLLSASGLSPRKVVAWVEGGAERQHSVAKGLAAMPPECELVAVHDSARALVTPQLISRCVAEARAHGGAIAAIPVADTLKQVEATQIRATVPRAGLWAAQTPQVFRRAWLDEAHAVAREAATDDAAIIEALGHAVRVVESESPNPKITTSADLALVERWLQGEPARKEGA